MTENALKSDLISLIGAHPHDAPVLVIDRGIKDCYLVQTPCHVALTLSSVMHNRRDRSDQKKHVLRRIYSYYMKKNLFNVSLAVTTCMGNGCSPGCR